MKKYVKKKVKVQNNNDHTQELTPAWRPDEHEQTFMRTPHPVQPNIYSRFTKKLRMIAKKKDEDAQIALTLLKASPHCLS